MRITQRYWLITFFSKPTFGGNAADGRQTSKGKIKLGKERVCVEKPKSTRMHPQQLDGQVVLKLIATEMALSEMGPDWSHPDVPCLQLERLFFYLADGRVVKLASSFNDNGSEFLLEECTLPTHPQNDPDSMFRTRMLDEQVGGEIQSIKIEDAGNGVELWHLQIGLADLILVAGEVESEGDAFLFRRPDESILLFSSLKDLESILWNDYGQPWDLTSIVGAFSTRRFTTAA